MDQEIHKKHIKKIIKKLDQIGFGRSVIDPTERERIAEQVLQKMLQGFTFDQAVVIHL